MRKIILVITMISLSFLLFNCEKESIIDNNENELSLYENTISMDTTGIIHEIGINHNLCLNFIQTNLTHSDTHYVCGEIINNDLLIKRVYYDSALILIEDYMEIQGYSTNEISTAINNINNVFSNANMFVQVNNNNYVKPITGHIQALENAAQSLNLIEQTDYTLTNNIINNVISENLDVADSLIQNINLNNYSLSTDKSIFALKSTYPYSNNYWTNYYNERDIEPMNPDAFTSPFLDALAARYGGWGFGSFVSYFNDLGVRILENLMYGDPSEDPNPCGCPVCAGN